MRIIRFSLSMLMLSMAFMVYATEDSAPSRTTTAVSAEGVAKGFVEGLIAKDGAKVRVACVKPYGNQEYDEALNEFVSKIEAAAALASSPPEAPKSIQKIFAARQLSSTGAASYGYAAFDFRGVVFVDIAVVRYDEKEEVYRLLVVKDAQDHWFVHPLPDISPLLSDGLWNEPASTIEFKS